eukprot:m.102110 g.102110  ORF g.102110 m.102110 type:complete len:112 (+) comp10424_c1_seq3:63-398(+)
MHTRSLPFRCCVRHAHVQGVCDMNVHITPFRCLTCGRYYTTMLKEGEFESKRRAQARLWMWTHVTDHLMERFKESDHVRAQVERIQQRVESGELTSGQGADMLLEAAFRRD